MIDATGAFCSAVLAMNFFRNLPEKSVRCRDLPLIVSVGPVFTLTSY